jgi:hypothetical protein
MPPIAVGSLIDVMNPLQASYDTSQIYTQRICIALRHCQQDAPSLLKGRLLHYSAASTIYPISQWWTISFHSLLFVVVCGERYWLWLPALSVCRMPTEQHAWNYCSTLRLGAGSAPPAFDVYFEGVAGAQLAELVLEVPCEMRQKLVGRLIWDIPDG